MSNPFEILGLEPCFALEPSVLERRQRDLNKALHPDQHSSKSAADRRRALSRAMDINQAYRTLRDPASRAEALLALLGVDGGKEQRSSTPPSLLMEMMDQREELEGARRSADVAKVRGLGSKMKQRQQLVEEKLQRAFASLLRAAPSNSAERPSLPATDLRATVELVSELRYVRRFRDEVAAIEDEL